MTDPVAPQVAGFDVTGLLGAGSGGEVWLGRDRGTGEQVALKRVRPGAGLAARDRLRREAAALAGLTHPHVLRMRSVVGCLDAPDDLVLVLDAALGGSLARLVARHGPRPPGQVVTVLVAVAGGLAAVHSAGLAHGDVTPSNVLVTDDGRPVLGDLGSARLGAASIRPGNDPAPPWGVARGDAPVGTPGFADPSGVGGPAADVHGVAATCVYLLTGRPPYDSAGARVPLDRDTTADPAVRRLMAVLEPALHPDPGQRPDAARLARAGFDAARPEPMTVDLLDAASGAAGWAAGEGPEALVQGASGATSWGVPITQLSAAGWAGASGPASGEALDSAAAPRSGRRRGAHARPRAARTRGSPWSWSALRRRGVAALGTALVVALAAVTGIAWAGAGPAPSPGQDVGARSAVSRQPSVASTDAGRHAGQHTWSTRLRALDLARSAAFAAGDVDALDRVYAAGSPALRRDRRAVRDLTAEGLRAAGVRLRAVDVRVVSASGGEVRLAVSDELAPYRLLETRTGRVVERRPGRGRAGWLLTLTRHPDGWRVWDVTGR